MIKKASLIAAALFTAGSAFAGNEVGVYFTPSADVNTGAAGTANEIRGDGFGVVGKFDLFGPTFVKAEYSAVTYDEQTGGGETDLNQARVGFGATIPLPGTPLAAMAYAEVVNLDIDDGNSDFSETGGGVHAGLVFTPNTAFSVFGQMGYIDVDNFSGGEYKLGINVNTGSRVTLFSEYRGSDLENEDNNDSKTDLDDFHIGATYNF